MHPASACTHVRLRSPTAQREAHLVFKVSLGLQTYGVDQIQRWNFVLWLALPHEPLELVRHALVELPGEGGRRGQKVVSARRRALSRIAYTAHLGVLDGQRLDIFYELLADGL
jgi:hypothetical protein